MAGRITNSEKQLRPDPRFGDKVLAKFINCVMLDGKKSTAQRAMYAALDKIQARLDKDKREGMPETAIEAFRLAIENVRPNVEVRSKRVGGANYQVPREVKRNRQQTLAIRWLIDNARKKKGKPMADRLAEELVEPGPVAGRLLPVSKVDEHVLCEHHRVERSRHHPEHRVLAEEGLALTAPHEDRGDPRGESELDRVVGGIEVAANLEAVAPQPGEKDET